MRTTVSLYLLSISLGCTSAEKVPNLMMADGRIWMTKNLDIDIPGSFCWPDSTLCVRYGRLYTWPAAITGCERMGPGWKLPTNEEWQKLARSYGGVYDDSSDGGKSSFIALSQSGGSGFNAWPGGNRSVDGKFERLGAHGFYWTITPTDSAEAWFYNFAEEAVLLNRHTGNKSMAISVRCIKEKRETKKPSL